MEANNLLKFSPKAELRQSLLHVCSNCYNTANSINFYYQWIRQKKVISCLLRRCSRNVLVTIIIRNSPDSYLQATTAIKVFPFSFKSHCLLTEWNYSVRPWLGALGNESADFLRAQQSQVEIELKFQQFTTRCNSAWAQTWLSSRFSFFVRKTGNLKRSTTYSTTNAKCINSSQECTPLSCHASKI